MPVHGKRRSSPSWARASLTALPIPLPPPVTTATFPGEPMRISSLNCPSIVLFLGYLRPSTRSALAPARPADAVRNVIIA